MKAEGTAEHGASAENLRATTANNGPRRGVVGVIVSRGRLLVIRRSQWVVAPGAYCFPGGGIEDSETEEQALVRELQEELQMAVSPQRRLWTSTTAWGVHLSWWLAGAGEGAEPRPQPAEVESAIWFTPNELAALPDLLESNQHFLSALHRGELTLPELNLPPR